MSATGVSVIVIAKEPVAGRVKTRLTPPLAPEQSAKIAASCIADTLAAVAGTAVSRRVVVLDGAAGDWIPDAFEVIAQRGGGLDERLAAAFEDVGGPAILVGMDTPQLTPQILAEGIEALGRPGVDAVLGPALDGGYWAIGLRAPDHRVFAGVPMSVEETLAEQRRRLDELGLATVELCPLRDLDTIEDARAIARQAPRTRFAAALAAMPVGLLAAASLALAGCGDDAPDLRPAAEPADSPPLSSRPDGEILVTLNTEVEGLVVDGQTRLAAAITRQPVALTLVDVDTGKITARIPLPATGRHLDLPVPGGPVLVPTESNNSLVIAPLDGSATTEIATGPFPHDAARIDGRIFVGDEKGDTLSVIADGKVIDTIDTPLQPGGVAAGGGVIAVIAVAERVLATYDPETLEEIARLQVGVGPTHIVTDGELGFVADTEGDAILAFDLVPKPKLLWSFDAPGTPYGIAVDPTRQRVWATLTATNQAVEISYRGGTPKLLATHATVEQPNTIDLDPRSGDAVIAARDQPGQLQRIPGSSR